MSASVLVSTVSHSHLLLSSRSSKTSRYVWPRFLWSHRFFPGSKCTQDLVCALPDWNLYFCQSHGFPVITSHWSSKPNALGAPPPNVWPLGQRSWNGAQNSNTPVENLCDVIIFQLVNHPPSEYEIWLYCRNTPPTILFGFFFVFGYKLSFLVGSSLFLTVAQHLVVILVFSWEEVSSTSSTLPSCPMCTLRNCVFFYSSMERFIHIY